MVGRRQQPAPAGIGRRVTRSTPRSQNPVPDVYREMLAEAVADSSPTPTAGVAGSASPQPQKRKRPGVRNRREPPAASAAEPEAKKLKTGMEADVSKASGSVNVVPQEGDEDEDEDLEFEDVPLATPEAQVQTAEIDSDDEEDDDILFEDVELPALAFDPANLENMKANMGEETMEFNLSKHQNENPRKTVERRRAISREERKQRIEVHKMHILCLLSHVSRRNRWCNDEKVQDLLRPFLSDKIIKYLNPGRNLPQFGQYESLKNGIKMAGDLFHAKFHITERGMKRTLWAEELEHLESYKLPEDLDSAHEKCDFQIAAENLEGSRDVGAQLFCALLRSAGVEARLVCSLQPLPFAAGSPALPKPIANQIARGGSKKKAPPTYKVGGEEVQSQADPERPSFVSRVGSHSRWLNYNFMAGQPSSPAPNTPKRTAPSKRIIKESAFPIYWVEVLDVANQKWQPVDPIVTCSSFKASTIEPPAADRENTLAYAIAFNEDGSAKDVTRRYAKAYNAKTRRIRLEGLSSPTPGVSEEARNAGERWLKRALRFFRSQGSGPSDVDQIENAELNRIEAREPMPRNLADFKDHPIYALERHMRRHEVLVPGATFSGTVGAGHKGPLERIYRRRDVRVARSQQKWYRLGRIIKPGEVPVKILPPRAKKPGQWDDDEDENCGRERNVFGEIEEAGTHIFTFDQTSLYVPPPVVNGQVPKNRFGNLDVYVPSMVPEGGVHMEDESACRAAYVLGVDYAPALMGFQFKGRQGTAVLKGAVVAKEHEEAVLAMLEGFRDLEEEIEQERRERRALRMWRRFMHGLRVRERIWRGVDEEEEGGEVGAGAAGGDREEGEEDPEDNDREEEGCGEKGKGLVVRRARGNAKVLESEDEDEDGMGGGGFEGGGGFMVEDGDYGGGGFFAE
ncbi:hypothetical protein MKZ38_004548 [Zalerion maritima]|uniref:Rad4-domain-containing protein n=1 Tax=Zalerion maritima TaxID=339359 RepID=A0AAD5RMF0_9PEZI|nr:hypothetical protein MKZ38_004548 [Zalerion maritima]